MKLPLQSPMRTERQSRRLHVRAHCEQVHFQILGTLKV